nr:hypothetical protein [Tanacetum cinerariifolium]
MPTLNFAEVYNMVAFLSKPTESAGFEQIIDFLNAHPIKYALIVNPAIYTSCIEQFWTTVKAKNINGEAQIHAKVGRGFPRRDTPLFLTMMVQAKKELGEDISIPTKTHPTPIISQPSTSKPQKKQKPRKPRRQDTKETQPSDPIINVVAGDLLEDTIPTHSNNPPISRVNTLRSREDRLKLKELMKLCTKLSDRVLNLETTKTNQAKEIANLKKRVKRLEKKRRSRTHELKRLYKVGLSARVESSKEESLKVIEDITTVGIEETVSIAAPITTTVTINELTLAQELAELKSAKPRADKIVIQEQELGETTTTTVVTTASTRPKAKSIVMQEPSETSTTTTIPISLKVQDKGKAIMVEEPLKMKKKDQILFDEEVARKLQEEIYEQERLVRERARQEKEANSALIETWEDIQEKQRIEDKNESVEIMRCLEIVPDDGDDATIDATPLSSKSPTIVDYKIYKEGRKSFFQIIRADVDDMDSFLLHTLKTMFKHHVEDNVWRNQQGLVKSSSNANSDGGEYGLTISLPLFLVVACDLVDVVCLDDGAWVFAPHFFCIRTSIHRMVLVYVYVTISPGRHGFSSSKGVSSS